MIFVPFHHASDQDTRIEWNCEVCGDRLVAMLPGSEPSSDEVKQGVDYLRASHRCVGKPGLTFGVEK